MNPHTAAVACVFAAALVFGYVATLLISGAWKRRRFEQAEYVMVMARHPSGWVVVRKNRPEHLAGYLLGPGGKVEPGESVEAAARRELREETGTVPYSQGALLGTILRIGVKPATLGGDIAIFACAVAGDPRSMTDEDVFIVGEREMRAVGLVGGRAMGTRAERDCVTVCPVWHDLPMWAAVAERALAAREDLL